MFQLPIDQSTPMRLLCSTLSILAVQVGGYKDGEEFVGKFLDIFGDDDRSLNGMNALRDLVLRLDGAEAVLSTQERNRAAFASMFAGGDLFGGLDTQTETEGDEGMSLGQIIENILAASSSGATPQFDDLPPPGPELEREIEAEIEAQGLAGEGAFIADDVPAFDPPVGARVFILPLGPEGFVLNGLDITGARPAA